MYSLFGSITFFIYSKRNINDGDVLNRLCYSESDCGLARGNELFFVRLSIHVPEGFCSLSVIDIILLSECVNGLRRFSSDDHTK